MGKSLLYVLLPSPSGTLIVLGMLIGCFGVW